MTKRLITLLTALLVLGFVVAGCGDDESGDSASGGGTAAETAPDTVTNDETVTDEQTDTGGDTTADETVTEDGGGASAPPANREQAVENCRKGVNAAKQLSADAKDKLQDICEKAASGDQDAVREAARDVCQTIVEDTFPEDAPGREQALESCDRNNGGQ